MLEHGGKLLQAAKEQGIPLQEWLDLSTGINPEGWPVPPLPPEVWQRLPELNDGLEQAASTYYGNHSLLPVSGSQAAIQALPQLFPPATIACLTPTYAEHPEAWKNAGHKLRQLPAGNLKRALIASTPHILLCNPNNPTGHSLDREEILDAARQMARRGGWLFVDEAFADASPEHSVADQAGTPEAPNLVVYRSLGKFFGLAGARVGFVLGNEELLQALQEKLGPWTVNHPGRWVATQALQDKPWQDSTRQYLQVNSQRLLSLLTPLVEVEAETPASTPLFVTLDLKQPLPLYNFLKARGILVRRFSHSTLLRFGLPGPEAAWNKLETVLKEWSSLC